METRKVQLSGGTTYTVSLPKPWAEEHGIEAGSELSLHANADGSLLVEPVARRGAVTEECRVDVTTDSDELLRQRVYALYAVGVDTVTLADTNGHSPDRRAVVQDVIAALSGFEIIESTETTLRVNNLIDASHVDMRKSTLRLRLVAMAMHRDAVEAVSDGDETLARRVISRDDEADKIFVMVARHFRRALVDLQETEKLDDFRDNLFEYYYLCRQLERIADHAERIATFAVEPEIPLSERFKSDLSSLGASARQVVDGAVDAILAGGGSEAAQRALTDRDSLLATIDELDRTLYDHDDPAEAHTVGLLLESIRRTAEYGGNVASMAIQHETKRRCYR